MDKFSSIAPLRWTSGGNVFKLKSTKVAVLTQDLETAVGTFSLSAGLQKDQCTLHTLNCTDIMSTIGYTVYVQLYCGWLPVQETPVICLTFSSIYSPVISTNTVQTDKVKKNKLKKII